MGENDCIRKRVAVKAFQPLAKENCNIMSFSYSFSHLPFTYLHSQVTFTIGNLQIVSFCNLEFGDLNLFYCDN